MRALLIVLPSSLAMRRLSELLALKAEESGAILYPPKIVTVGALPETLYSAKLPFASDLVQQLAWMKVLRETKFEDLKHLVPIPPNEELTAQWLELGKVLAALHRELASDRLNFQNVAQSLGHHIERPRWDVLSDLQQRYLKTLDQLALWDIQTARLVALEQREPKAKNQIIVIGCVDLNKTQRGFLDAVRDQVEVWIAAPESEKQLFDNFGCLRSSQWKDYTLDISGEQLYVGDSPADQAELATSCIAGFGNRFHTRQVTLGVPDHAIVPELQRRLSQSGVTARYGPGTPLAQSETIPLLLSIGEYLEKHSYVAFAKLIRQPAVGNLIRVLKKNLPENWLSEIDRYYQASLPKLIDGTINEEAQGAQTFGIVTKTVNRWLAKLGTRRRKLADFVQPLLSVLALAYDKQLADLNDEVEGKRYRACQQVAQAILALRDIPASLQPEILPHELINWLVNSIAANLVAEAPNPQSVEMLGWLELALDDAPALVIAGMHDGVVPESVNADTFLPNSLRNQLGMMDNERRYARDMYSMQVALESREELNIVVGRRDESGDPLVPSRLLMACDLEKLPSRVLHLVESSQTDVAVPTKRQQQNQNQRSGLVIPRPEEVRPISRISVTAFREYLRCPYRFYLKHVLKLRGESDDLAEMDAPQFGNLIHDTLALLEGDIGHSQDAEEITAFLTHHLHSIADSVFGKSPAAAVLIQIEQAELRLRNFAVEQAKRAAEGWEIRYVETGVDAPDGLKIGHGGELNLIGRIDRIDYHPDTKRWAIWDYKTSDKAKAPVTAHWTKKDGWIDLQLPLYRHIAPAIEPRPEGGRISGDLTLGYISLPKQAADAGFYQANFSEAQFAEADQLANDIATAVAEQQFWPDEIESVNFDDFSRICQTQAQVVCSPQPTTIPNRATESSHESLTEKVCLEAHQKLTNRTANKPDLKPLLIRASAGTGKTFQLTNRLLDIILSGEDVDTILATTFTRKAAGEITERVLERLAYCCIDANARDELGQFLPTADLSQANCLATLKRLTSTLHRLRILTLDSFFSQVARTFSFEMGLPPGWNAMDPVQEPYLQMQAIGSMLDSQDRKTLVDLVRMLAKGESQRQVSDEIRRTVSSGFAAYRITSAEAWDQLPLPSCPSESALDSALMTIEQTKLGNKSADQQIEKLHLAGKIGDWEAVISHGIFSKIRDGESTYYRKEIPADLLTALNLLAERAAAEILPIRRNQTLASYKVLDAFNQEYSQQIRRTRLLSFSDITFNLSRWMRGEEGDATSNERETALAYRLDCGVNHLLLDEFQDTAPEQWNILSPLATPLAQNPQGDSKSILCVGDTKQAIYGWRGGVAEVFDAVKKTVPSIENAELKRSFRSSPVVIDSVNEVFQNLSRHSKYGDCDAVATNWSKQFPEHSAAKEQLAGYVVLENGPAIGSDIPIEERHASFLKHSALKIADLAKNSSAEIGVLLRTNLDVARMMSILRDLGVPASQDGGNPLTDSSAVELICSLIHLADHPGDSVCRFHVASSPLADKLPVQSPVEISAWLRGEVAERGLGATIETLCGWLSDKLNWWDNHRLEQLIRLAYQYQSSVSGRLREFEEAVEKQKIALPSEAQVKVMTVHKSKGLEFDAVFLPELEIDIVHSNTLLVLRGKDPCEPPDGVLRYMNSAVQGLLPESWQRAFGNHKDGIARETLCLLYVAMTRAKQALYMTARPVAKQSSQKLGSLLQSVLGDKESRKVPDSIIFESGNAEWYQQDFPPIEENEAQASDASLEVQLRSQPSDAPSRGLKVAVPSGISRSFDPLPLANAFSYSHSLSTTYGTLVHAFFEQVEWLDDFQIDRDALRKVAMSVLSPDESHLISIDNAIDEFEEMLSLSSVRSALSRSRYRYPQFGESADKVEIDNERLVNVVVDDQLVSGSIDRLAILLKDGQPFAAEIIDFKTDRFDPNMTLLWLEDRVEHHRPQLEVYAQVVQRLFRIPRNRIRTYLVMLSTDDLVRVDDTPATLSKTATESAKSSQDPSEDIVAEN